MRGNKRIFTEEERKYIFENWGKESAHSMKKKFNCSWDAVCAVAKEYGLEMPKNNEWSDEQIQTLRILAEKYHYEEIAKIMGKSENAIYLKARRLGLTLIQDRRKWTKEEEQILKDLWGQKNIEQIAKKLKRTVFSLKVKAVRMELGPMIRNNSELILVSDICELLNVTEDRVRITWVKLGLNLQEKKLTNNKSYRYIIWKDLLDFLENNQNEWDSRSLEKNMLGIEPEWLLEKRKRDEIENPLWYRRWSSEEINQAITLFKNGKNYAQIAEIINRSEWSVAYILRNNGYSYRLPQYWKGSELLYLRENYMNMTYEEIGIVLGRTTKAVGAKAEDLGYKKRLILNKKDGE
ncbi:MAG: hypothetical protein IJA94_02780 [Bacilli bacterium]|nr:hypothetical protein [Bacilli bacterium]